MEVFNHCSRPPVKNQQRAWRSGMSTGAVRAARLNAPDVDTIYGQKKVNRFDPPFQAGTLSLNVHSWTSAELFS
jgi:hypothetical protein